MPPSMRDAAIRDLAPTGVVRAAINTANPVLARKGPDGLPQGVSVDIAQELGRSLGRPVQLIAYETAGRVFDALDRSEWDLAFLAIEPARATRVIFSSPYVVIEGTYLVRSDATFTRVAELDSTGTKIAVGLNAAYDLYLSRHLEHAEIVRAPTPNAALEMFATEGLEAAAGIRQALEAFAAQRPGFRVLPDPFMTIRQALATPQGREDGGQYLNDFIDNLKSSGCLRAALDRNGQAGVSVAWP